MPTISSGAKADRNQLRVSALGFLAETFPQSVVSNTLVLVGGTAYGTLIGLRGGDTVSNIVVQVNTAGSGVTLFKAGVYSKDGLTKYAASADASSSFGSAGMKAVALSASWTVPADDGYMLVVVATASTTLPALTRVAAQGAATSAVNGGALPYCIAGTGLSDLPAAPATFSMSGTPVGLWLGAY